MEILQKIKSLTLKRWIWMILGNVILALGVAIMKWSQTGNDPYSGMNMSVAENVLHISYGTFLIIINCFVFLVEIFFGRKHIGLGTFVNWFLIGILVDLVYPVIIDCFGPAEGWPMRIGLMVLGVVVTGFACATYQAADAGISPYDSLSLIIHERLHIPYFAVRITTDGICALVCFLTGGIVGLGMLANVLCLGPIISFFNGTFCKRFIREKE